MTENYTIQKAKLEDFLNRRKITPLHLPKSETKGVQLTNIKKESILILSLLLFKPTNLETLQNDILSLFTDSHSRVIYYWGINTTIGATLVAFIDSKARLIVRLIYAKDENSVNLCLETTRHEYGINYLLELED